jgi:hypothetical protein
MAAATPLVDATVAMIPGLAAQSRVGNNPEIGELRLCQQRPGVQYFAIRSNFEPDPVGVWKFWEWFRKDRIADLGADFVFPGHNDLVVDTDAMDDLADALRIPSAQVHDYDTNPVVHHCNYFEQPRTVEKLREWLQIP